jgi:hypothetical protein
MDRQEIQIKLQSIMGGLSFKGDKIQYFYESKLVGEIELPEGSFTESRHALAELARVDAYDDFWLVRANGDVIKASEKFIEPLLTSTDNGGDSIGVYEGKMYRRYKTTKTCESCGNKHYGK